MKMKTIRHLFILFFVVLCHVACQENYYIENELHGLWQVTRVEDKTTGESTEAQGELYYSFQRNMVILGYNAPDKPTGLMMTQYASEFYLNSDSLEIGDFRIYLEYNKKAPLDKLKKFGIHSEHTNFHIDKSRKGHMTLESDKARVELRKY